MNKRAAMILSLLFTCIAAGTTVPKWEPRDFAFTSDAEHGNPFMVRFAATIRAPDGRAVQALGFYDGDHTWKVRVAPWAEGAWSLTTDSDDPALAGRQVSFTCVANANSEIHGPLRVDGDHPHWFMYADGTRGYVMGYEADWLWALDMTGPDTPTLNGFLDKLKGHGFNYIVLNAYAHDTSWRKGRTGDDDYGPPPMYAWMGSNENPDHSRLNLAYWRHYDRMMTALLERGITAHLMIKVYNKSVNWPERGSAEDDLYFKWIVARYGAFPNVVWDFSKEAFYEKDVDYKIGRVKLIRENDPYQRLVTIHDDNVYDKGTWDELADFHADQSHGDDRHKKILEQRARGGWPVMNIEFGYEHGPKGPNDKTYGGSQSPEVVCQRAWELVTAGAYINYYYTYTAWDVVRPGDTPPGYGYFKILRDFWDSVEYWKMSPADQVVDKGYCLADPGREYVVYQGDAQPFTLDLGDVSGTLAAEWLHPFTGQRVRGQPVAGGKHLLSPPPQLGATPVVLHLRKQVSASKAGEISGELKTWHKVTITFEGPQTSETAKPNPFTDYRLDVTFSQGDKRYVVAGYYAADGDAANTSATSGNKWRVHFAPNEPGRWTYSASFRKGPSVAVSDDPQAGAGAGYMDGQTGSFTVEPTDKKGRDFRGKGWLQYVGRHHLRFAGTGEYFLKAGADAPETFLAYADFDGTEARKKNVPLKTWQPHLRDWRQGDPTWKGGKGKGMIGALNYMASKGCNVFSFLTYNAGGDGDNVWPFIERNAKLRYDCSKLDQWGIVFDHATKLGLYLHFKLQENEMDDDRRGGGGTGGVVTLGTPVPESLDGGELGPQRKLYCRELVARFGHNLALNWNIGEENTQSTEEIKDMIDYIRAIDPYKHLAVIHTYISKQDPIYTPLLGNRSFLTGASLQNEWDVVHQRTLKWVTESAAAGRPWVVANDEQAHAQTGVPPDLGYEGYDGKKKDGTAVQTTDDIRKATLWGNLMAGGAGVEYYFGYQLPQNDLVCEDWRSREKSWDYARIALEFFRDYKVPFWDMKNADTLIGNVENDNSKYCLAKAGEVYLVFLPNGGTTNLDLGGVSGTFAVKWYNPRTGGALQEGSVTRIAGPGSRSIGNPPSDPQEDWAVLIRP